MRTTSRLRLLLLILALLVPAVAAPAVSFAQSAGDDQYVDPFQDSDGNDQGSSGNQGNSGNQGGNDPPAQQPAAQAPAEPSDPGGTTASESAAGDNTLARTGLPTGPIVAVGVILLLGGLALRRAWPLPE